MSWVAQAPTPPKGEPPDEMDLLKCHLREAKRTIGSRVGFTRVEVLADFLRPFQGSVLWLFTW